MAPRDRKIADEDRRRREVAAGNGSDGAMPESAHSADAEERARRSRVELAQKYLVFAIGGLVALIVVLSLILLLALQTNWGREHAKTFALSRLNALLDGAEFTAGRLEGTVIGRLSLENLNLVKADGEQLAHVDTFSARYSLIHLLQSRLRITNIELINPRVWMTQNPDGSWDLLNVIARDDSATVDTVTTESRLVIALDHLFLANGALDASFYSEVRDSILLVRDVYVDMGNAEFGQNFFFEVDSLVGRFTPPAQDYWADLRLGGAVTREQLVLEGLRLRSPRSNVEGRGVLSRPVEDEDYVRNVEFEFMAEPIAFDDIRSFLPGLRAGASAQVEIDIGSTNGLLGIDAGVRFSDGGYVTAEGTVSPDAPDVKYALRGEVRGFDISLLTSDPSHESSISADVAVDLSGDSPQRLSGSADATLVDTRYGAFVLSPTVLQTKWEQGHARINLRGGLRSMRFSLAGTTRPLDDTPNYHLSGRLDDLDIGRFLDSSNQRSDLSASFRVDGQGLTLPEAEFTAEVQVAPSTVNNARIDFANLELTMVNRAMQFGVRARFPNGQLYAQGDAELGDVPTYAVRRGQIENVDIAAILGQSAPSSIFGNFSMNGTGSDPETLTLQGSIDLYDSQYGDVTIAASNLNVGLRQGSLQANTAADLVQAGSFSFVVEGRPFQDIPTLQVTRGEFRNIDLGPLLGSSEMSTDFSGSAVARIRGFDSPSMAMSGRLDLDRSRVQQQTINDAYVIVEGVGGSISFSASVDLPEGQASMAGSARPFEQVPTYEIPEGRFRNIDLAAFTGNETLRSSFTGTFSVDGRGFDPATMVTRGQLQIAPSRINQQQINTVRAQVQVQRGVMQFTSVIVLPDGDVRLAGNVDFREDATSFAIEQGDFENVNVGAVTGTPDFQTNLTGTLSLEGGGLESEGVRLSGTIELADSRINQQEIRAATVQGSLANNRLDFGLTMIAPEGVTDLAGHLDLSEEVATYHVTEGSFQALNLGSLLGNPDLQTSLTGSIELEGRGIEPEAMTVSALIDLDRSVVNRSVIMDGIIDASLDDGLILLDGTITTADGSANFDARARLFDDPPTYQAAGAFINIDIGGILTTDTLYSTITASFDVTGSGFEPETMTLRGRVVSDTMRYQQARISLFNADFSYERGLLDLDTLILRSNFADVNAGGLVAFYGAQEEHASNLWLLADIHDADPIRRFIPAEAFAVDDGHFDGRLFGRPGRLRFDLDTDITNLVYNDVRMSGVVGRFSGEFAPDGQLQLGEFEARLDYFSLPYLTLRSSDLSVSYRDEEIVFSGDFLIDDRRNAHLAGLVDLRSDSRRVVIDAIDLVLDQDQWELLQPATITFDGQYRVRNLLLYSADQQLAIDGVIDPDGMQNLVMTIEDLRIGAVADLLGYQGLDGTVSGGIDVTGPAFAPRVDGTLEMDIASEGRPVGDLDLSMRYDSLRMNLDALLTHQDGSTLVIAGYVPMDLAFAPADTAAVGDGLRVHTQQVSAVSGVSLSILADSFAIDWIDPFLDRAVMERVSGRLSSDIEVSGTFGAPILDGFVNVTQGRIRLPEFNVTYEDIQLAGRLEDNRMIFEDARITSNGGALTASGQVMLADLALGEFDIDARLDEFLAVENQEYHATVSGDVHLSGTTRDPVVTGGLRLISTDIFLDETASAQIEEVALTDRDIRVLEERFGRRITEADTARAFFYENMTMDLSVRMERNTWIRQRRNPRMAIQFEGRLDVQKQPQQDPNLFGTIEVIPQRSYIDQFGRRFDIASGTITFNGPAEELTMDVQAEYQVRRRRNPGEAEATILLGLKGRLDDLIFTLESDPPMEETNILSYIATGQPAGQTLQLSDAGSLITQQGAGAVAAVIEGIAGEGLGLDVIEIQHEGLRGAVLIAGKYVSRRAYVGVSQPVSFTTSASGTEPIATSNRPLTELTVEYEIFRWLLMRLSGGAAALRGNLFWEFAY